MTDQALDAMMKCVLMDALKLDCEAEAKNSALVFHPPVRHQRQMRLMLMDPLKWARRKFRPMWKSIAQKVAVVLLIVFLGFAILMVSSPTARATLVRWITEWYETHIVYRYAGENISENMPQYEITVLPEGFVESDRTELPRITSITYENGDGDVIYFNYSLIAQGSGTTFDTQDSDVSDIEVNHMSGQFFESKSIGNANTIIWFDTEQNIHFDISGECSFLDILNMAESVSLVKTMK